MYTYIGWLLALRLSVDRYPQIFHIYTCVNSYMLMILLLNQQNNLNKTPLFKKALTTLLLTYR